MTRAIIYKKKENPLANMPQELFIWKVDDGEGGFYFQVSDTQEGIDEEAEFVGKYFLANNGVAKVVRTTALVPFHK